MKRKTWAALGGVASVAIAACGGADNPVPVGTPEPLAEMEVSRVAEGGFQAPLDAVASPDGQTFYFTAFTDEAEPRAAVFSVPASGGEATIVHAGAPLAYPGGLVMSCDGATLIVADASLDSEVEEDDLDELEDDDALGSLYRLDVASQALTRLEADAVGVPNSLAISFDCKSLYIAGQAVDGTPALFKTPLEGGPVETVYQGAPLQTPTGMYVDADDVAWVLDHDGEDAEGVLYAITADGDISPVVTSLTLGTPGGCSLNAAGDTAYMPTTGDDVATMTTVSLADGSMNTLVTPGVVEPAGLRTAREASVFALVDHEGDSIYSAQ